MTQSTCFPSPPFRGEREGPGAERWEGEVGLGERSGIPSLTPTLSTPPISPKGGGEGATWGQLCHFGAPSPCLAPIACSALGSTHQVSRPNPYLGAISGRRYLSQDATQ